MVLKIENLLTKNILPKNFFLSNCSPGRRVIELNRRQVNVHQVSTSETIDHLDEINFVNWNFGKILIFH